MIRRAGTLSLCVTFGLACVFVLSFAFLRTASVQAAATLCVKIGGGDGCYYPISAALNVAQPGDTIRVAAGTYTENLVITKTLSIEGGWNTSFTARDTASNVTTLRPADPDVAIVTIQGQFGNTSAVAPTIDGFTISGARSTNHGGGLRVTNSDAIISHNVITDNAAYFLGGGIWVQNGAPRIENNRIEHNRVTPSGAAYGGGIELEGTRATLAGNLIAHNAVSSTTGYGGGVAVDGGGPVALTGNIILSNSATISGSSETGRGGGISLVNVTATLSSNVVQDNVAGNNARGYGGGVYIFGSKAFTLTGNTVISNHAGFAPGSVYLMGGGVHVESSNGHLVGNLIIGNHANRYLVFGNGGGVAALTSTLDVQGGQILNNSTSRNCEGYGGGLYAQNSSLTLDAARVQGNCAANTPFYGLGGGLAFVNSPYTLTNAIVADNYAFGNDTAVGGLSAGANSPGLLVNNTIANNRGQGIRSASPLTLTNSIIMSHTTGVSLTVAVPVSVTYNDFYNNAAHQRGFSLDVSNVVIHPQLDSNYRLTAASILIDAGTRTNAPAHDLDGQPRPMQSTSGLFRFDIGADEYPGSAQVNRNFGTQPADFTLIGPGNPQDNETSSGSNDWIGYAVAGGDVNGDNRADLIAGAPNLSGDFDGGTNDDGRVFALYNNGARRLGVVDLFSTTAGLEVRSWLHQQHIGRAFAAGDIDGDGRRDLIIGSIGGDNNGQPVTGTVYVFAGGAGLSGIRTLSPTMQATYRFVSSESTQSFGEANALAAGQLNGSGPADLVVGESNASGPGNRANAGAVRVFFGSSSLRGVWDTRVVSASLTIYGPAADKQLARVALADFNGDSQLDLIARSVDTVYVFYAPLSSGVIDLASSSASLSLGGFDDGPLAAGDVNGDRIADVVLGDGNRVTVVRGNTTNVLATFTSLAPSALHTLAWNTDGAADIAIGESSKNRVLVIFGSTTWSGTMDAVERANWVVSGEKPIDQFGFSLGSGDLDADGAADLILGSRAHVLTTRADPHFNDAGAVYVLYGGSGLLATHVYLPIVIK